MTNPQQPGDLRKQIAQAIHDAYGRHSLDRAYRATHNVIPLIQPLLDQITTLRNELAALQSCGASMPGIGHAPIGPCVLRHGHDGPVHQAASGATWWPRDPDPKETDQ